METPFQFLTSNIQLQAGQIITAVGKAVKFAIFLGPVGGTTCLIVQCPAINVQCALMKASARSATPIDLSLYAGRWIAIVRDRVAGSGRTPQEALLMAKAERPKEEPLIVFVPKNYRKRDKVTG